MRLLKALTGPIALSMMSTFSLAAVGQTRFNSDWRFKRGDPAGADGTQFDDAGWQRVELPHDWAIAGPIARDNPMGSPGGFFPSGVGWYRKAFDAPESWRGKRIAIQFDGVYRMSDVWVNGRKLGRKVDGFTPFEFDLTPHLNLGGANVVAVRVDNSREPSSRWYAGAGIYRHVWLDVRDPVHIARFGTFVRTVAVTDGTAKLSMSVTAQAFGAGADPTLAYATQVFAADPNGKPVGDAVATFATATGRFPPADGAGARTATAEASATLPGAKLWSPETPHLYVAVTTASAGGRVFDRRETTFGIRTIAVSAERGFELNGRPVELFGACIHDDNGPLGVAAFDRAEFRRAEWLKAAGFNAVRCSHNPPAPAFLDACDRLGLLVINESFDSWSYGKLENDYSRHFDENWEADLDAMILRDRNHPSIIMWSLGNEIHDFGSPQGLRNGIKLVDRARLLDPTRPTTTAVYWFNNIGGPHHWKWTDADELMSRFDVVGYNYAINRYEADHARVPGRIMVGSESYPRDLFVSWEQSTKLPYVLGDFVWTGIDYLGESGIGRYHRPDEPLHFHLDLRHFPYHGAYCGDIDITGFRKPISYARNIVWGRGETLYTSVTELTPDGQRMRVGDWGVIPSRASWTWPGHEGRPLEVQVYSRCDAVRLYLDDVLIGEKPTTRGEQFKAVFEVPYKAGTLRTVALTNGAVVAENVLRTAGPPVGLRLTADRARIAADGQDLSFVTVEAVDERGDVQPNADQMVTFEVDGPATLAGVANADFHNTDSYQGDRRRLFNGRAQFVLRSGDVAGTINVRATAEGLQPARVRVTAATP